MIAQTEKLFQEKEQSAISFQPSANISEWKDE
jgi:hypothetical protein